MDAVIIDLKDFVVRTPEQVVRVFYSLYSAEKVNAAFMRLFMRMGGVGFSDDEKMELADLFDHLNALVDAVADLHSGSSGASNCVICGAKRRE